jgi:cobyrinic acid a,c-diamide synthase
MSDTARILLAAPNSGTGKTTITLALLAALVKRGASPVAFKCGPDYIDPMFHREVLGIPSYNLDRFFTDSETVCGLLSEHAKGHDIAVIEGVMGYYDGVNYGLQASSYELAQTIASPVVLVVSAKAAALSLAALIKGFSEFKSPSHIVGVILNDCSEILYNRLKAKLSAETGLPMLGHFPRLPECAIESRHLGLVTSAEITDLRQKLIKLGQQAEQSLEIDALLKLARAAPPVYGKLPHIEKVTTAKPVIAVAKDNAFCFYYADNLALLRLLGAQIAEFSPLHDKALPEGTSGLYLGGGYPELYAKTLSENTAMLEDVRKAVLGGMPTIAECGGFLYLHNTLEDDSGISYSMAGVLPGQGYKTARLQRFGYINLMAMRENAFLPVGESMPAHEFHYWNSTLKGASCKATKPDGRTWECVLASSNLFAGFPHLYFYSHPAFAARFVKAAAGFGGY